MAEAGAQREAPEDTHDAALEGAIGRGSGLLGLRLVQYLFLFASSALVAKVLGPAGRAAYILPLNIAGIASLVTGLSIETASGRLLGRGECDRRRLIQTALAIACLCALVGSAGAAAVGLALRRVLAPASTTSDMLVATAVVIPTQIYTVAGGFLLRLGALRGYGMISALAASAQLAAVIVLYLTGELTVFHALLATLLGFTLTAIGLTGWLAHRCGPHSIIPRPARSLIRPLLRASFQVHPGTLTTHANIRLDLLIVSVMTSRAATGLYSLAGTLSDAAMFASLTIAQSALHVQVRERSQVGARYTLDFSRQCFLIACLGTLIASALMYPFIVAVYGSRWTGAVIPTIVTLWAVTVLTIEGPIKFYLIQEDRPLLTSVAAGATLVLNLGLDVALIPLLGIVGASLATLASYWLLALVMLRWFERATGLSTRGIFGRPRRGDAVVAVLVGALARAVRPRSLGRS